MSYLSDTVTTGKPTGALDPSQTVYGQVAYLAPDPPLPDYYINVRLTNGAGYYTAGGTSVSGGGVLTADQGAPSLLSSAWPVKVTDGSALFGTENLPTVVKLSTGSLGNITVPLWITGSTVISNLVAVSGSVSALVTGSIRLTEPPTVKLYDHVHGKDLQFGAFGILKATSEQLLADFRFNTASIAADWTVSQASGGGWMIEGGGTGVRMTTAASLGSRVTFRSNQSTTYQSGRGLMIKQSVILGDSGVAGNVREWGYYSPTGTSGSNGAYVQLSGSTLQWVITANGSGTVIPSSQWDVPVTPDPYGHLWYQQLQWLGVGNIYLYYDERLVHTYRFLGTSLNFSIGTPDLPVWFRNENVGNSSATYMKVGCVSVVSEGGPTAIRVGDPIVATDSAQLGKSVITGKTTAGGSAYVDVKVSPAGAVQVGGTLDSAGTATLSSGSVTGLLIGGQALGLANPLPTLLGGPNAVVTSLTSSVGSQLVLVSNQLRRGAIMVNDSPANCFLKFGAAASSLSYTYKLLPGQTLELPTWSYNGRIDAVWDVATGSLMVTEVTA